MSTSAIYAERAVELINSRPLDGSLYQGLPGVAWAVHALDEYSALPGASQFISDANEAILDSTENIKLDANLDVINGIAGILIYALRCMSKEQQQKLLRSVNVWIAKRFGHWSDDSQLAISGRSQATNLGIAHGVPGLLRMLSKAQMAGLLESELNQRFIDGLEFTWRFAVKERNGGSYMPQFQDRSTQGRLAWCYGSLGVAFTYLSPDSTWPLNARRANNLIKSCLDQYDLPSSHLKDASLCHGTSGVAYLFSRLAKEGGVDGDVCSAASMVARRATTRTLEQAIWEQDYVTFPYKSVNGTLDPGSFLEGRYGVALALDAIERAESPAWSEWLAI